VPEPLPEQRRLSVPRQASVTCDPSEPASAV
jgi:hypothetical protein